MSTITVKEITGFDGMSERFDLISQLNPKIEKEAYLVMLADMLKNGYRMAGAFDNDKCLGISGFWISTKIYSGKYVELDNVIIDDQCRSKGVGKLLCDWIIELAKGQGCRIAMLDAYVENHKGHQFYFREGFTIRGFHFLRKI